MEVRAVPCVVRIYGVLFGHGNGDAHSSNSCVTLGRSIESLVKSIWIASVSGCIPATEPRFHEMHFLHPIVRNSLSATDPRAEAHSVHYRGKCECHALPGGGVRASLLAWNRWWKPGCSLGALNGVEYSSNLLSFLCFLYYFSVAIASTASSSCALKAFAPPT